MASNDWGDEAVVVESPVDWGDRPAAQQDLPAGVEPSRAGAGRGFVAPPTSAPPAQRPRFQPDTTAAEYGDVAQGLRDAPAERPVSVLQTEGMNAPPPSRRLGLGAGPISQQTAADAEALVDGRATRERVADPVVQRAAAGIKQQVDAGQRDTFGAQVERTQQRPTQELATQRTADEWRSVGEWANDTGAALVSGAVSLAQLPVNIIAPGSALNESLQKSQQNLQDFESEPMKARRQELADRVNGEEGFLDQYAATVAELVSNPSVAIHETMRQAAMFAGVLTAARGGAVAAQGGVALASRASPALTLSEAISGGAIASRAGAVGATAGGVAANSTMAAGDAAGNAYEKLMSAPPEMWEQSEDYQNLIAKGVDPEAAKQEIATAKARTAAMIAAPLGLLGFMGAEASFVSRGAGRAAGQPLRVAATELITEPAEEALTQVAGNYAAQTVNPEQSLGEGAGEAAGMATVTSGPFAAAGAVNEMRKPIDRTEQIKALRTSGDTTAADMLKRRFDREMATYNAGSESQRLADFGPQVQQRYQEIRMAGAQPGDAVVKTAIRTGFERAAEMAGLSPKARAALDAKLEGMPPDKAPAVVQKYITALADAGAAQPFEGLATLATDMEGQMDRMLDAVIAGDIAPTLEGQTSETDKAATTEADTAGAGPAAVAEDAASGEQAALDALSEVNDVLVTPETDAVHQAATSPLNDLPEPTQAQKDAGNYKVGRVKIAGLNISVENPQGSVRRGTDEDGKAWESPLRDHYGYIRGTTAADGDKLDLFIKPGTPDTFDGTVFVVDQIDPKTGKFDEAKVIFGAADQTEAEAIYRRNYSADWQGLGAITALPMPEFKTWAASEATKKPLGKISEPTNVQDAPQGTARAEAQATPVEAQQAAGGDAATTAGVPAETGPGDGQAAGLTDRPDGTLAVKGDTKALRERLTAAGIPARSILPSATGVVVGKTQAKAAREALQDSIGQAQKISARDAQVAGEKARQAAKQDKRRAAQKDKPAPAGLRVGITPGNAEPVTVRDGIIFIGKNEAIDFDSGEPVKVKAGASNDDITNALKDAGALSRRQKVFRSGEDETTSDDAKQPMFSRSAPVDSPAFKKWFGESKVVDADGAPLVVYHGTNKTEQGEAFTMLDAYASNYGLFGQGAYLTADPSVASEYTAKGRGDSPSVYPLYASIKNPIDMDAVADPEAWANAYPDLDLDAYHEGGTTNESYYRAAEEALRDEGVEKWEGAEAMQDGLRRMGHDGITHIGGGRVKSEGKKHRVFIAFDPEQIKSATGNQGTFDPKNPDIRFDLETQQDRSAKADKFTVDGKPAQPDTPQNGNTRFTITDAQRKTVGRVQASIRERTGNAAYVLEAVERVSGREFVFAANLVRTGFGLSITPVQQTGKKVFNGAQVGNDLLMDVNTARPAMVVMGHELLHKLRRDDPVLYSFLKVQIETVLNDDAASGYAKTMRERYAKLDMAALSDDVAFEEMLADIVGDQFGQRKFWDLLATKNQGRMLQLARKVLEFFDSLLGKARKEFPFETDRYLKDVAKAREIVADVIAEYAQDREAAADADGVKFSVAPSTESAAFKKWFSGSKVVDAEGKPLVVYHGTDVDFSTFDKDKIKSRFPFSIGYHFTTRPSEASIYASDKLGEAMRDGGNVMPVYVRMLNPLIVDTKHPAASMEADLNSGPMFDKIRAARLAGKPHDGIIIRRERGDEWDGWNVIAFRPEQIKSATGNAGTFDPKNPDIRFSIAGPATKAPTPSPVTAPATPAQTPLPATQGNQPPRAPVPTETRARAAQRVIQDQFNRFTVIRNWAREQGMNLSQISDVWGFEERMHGRIATRVEDFREKRVQPLIERIQKAGFTMPQVAEYLHAQHAEERNKQILSIDPTNPSGSGMDTADAKVILAAAKPELVALANEFRKIADDTKTILLNGGIISQEMVDAWDKTYKHYVPLKGGDQDTQPVGTGKGLSVKATNKRALGHGERSEFIVENMLRDHERAVMLVEKNRVGHSLLAMTVELGRDDIATFGQPERRKVLKNTTSFEVVGRNGAVVGTFDSQQAANAFIVTQKRAGLTVRQVKGDPVVSYMASPMLAENEVQVYVKGQTVRIQLNDPLLARGYKKLGVEHLGRVMQVNREINGFLSKAYTGYNPEFFIKNVLRDFTSGLINITGQEGALIAAKAAARYPAAFGQMLRYSFSGGKKASPSIQAYREHGGTTGAAYLSDIERVGADIQSAYEKYQGALQLAASGKPLKAANVAGAKLVRLLIGFMEHLNAAGENAMRLAVFDAVRNEPGRTIQEAASLAKNSTVNFNRKGEMGAQANALYLFFNAAMQGTAATLDALLMAKHRHQAQFVAGALGALAYSLAALQFGGDDEEDREAWEKIPDHVKDRNLVIRTGEDTYITLAVPYGYGFFFAAGNAAFDLQRGADKDKIGLKLASGLVEHFGPAINPISGDELDPKGLVEIIPGFLGGELFRAGARLIVNRSGLGGEIVPESPFDEGKPDNLKAYRSTKGTGYEAAANMMSQITGGTRSQPGGIDVSPETLKFWTQTITGGAGKFVMDTANTVTLMSAMLSENDPEAANALTPEIRELPLVRTVVRKQDIRDTRRVYWEKVKEAEEAQKSFNRAKKMGDADAMVSLADQEGHLLALAKHIKKTNEAVKALRDTVELINLSDEYTRAEKRMMVKDLERGEEDLYNGMIRTFEAMEPD